MECVHILPQHSHARVAPWRSPWPALREIGREKGRAGLGRGAGRGGRLGTGDGKAMEEGVTEWDSHDLSWTCGSPLRD